MICKPEEAVRLGMRELSKRFGSSVDLDSVRESTKRMRLVKKSEPLRRT
jgi:hypothetical protein